MTVIDIMKQAQALSAQERKELVKMLVDSLDVSEPAQEIKTGAEIVTMLQAMDPIEFVDPHIEDPVEWVKAQRQKEADRLRPYRDHEN